MRGRRFTPDNEVNEAAGNEETIGMIQGVHQSGGRICGKSVIAVVFSYSQSRVLNDMRPLVCPVISLSNNELIRDKGVRLNYIL